MPLPPGSMSRRNIRRRSLGDDAAYVPRWQAAKREREILERELRGDEKKMTLMGGLQGFVDSSGPVMGPGMKSEGDVEPLHRAAPLLEPPQPEEEEQAAKSSSMEQALKEEIKAMRADEAEKDEDLRAAKRRGDELQSELEEVDAELSETRTNLENVQEKHKEEVATLDERAKTLQEELDEVRPPTPPPR
jgi:DNA repair exonuclease SbcCD ATPase subunit